MEAFRFEHSIYLWGFALIPFLVLLFYFYLRSIQKKTRILGDEGSVRRLLRGRPTYRRQIKFTLFLLAFSAFTLGLANPQFGSRLEKVKRKGIELFIAMDLSSSMMAEDLKPNRLERARQFALRLVDNLGGDQAGLIVFGGNAYLQTPLTSDHAAVKMMLNTVNTEMIPTQGTAIGEAIGLAMDAFTDTTSASKALVIITDGENHEGNALKKAKEGVEKGIKIFTVGVGTPKGAPIPVYRNGQQADYKRDGQGNIVFSKLNEEMLSKIAITGDGAYFNFRSGSENINKLIDKLAGLDQEEFDAKVFTDYEDQFQYLLGMGLIFVLINFFISEKSGSVNWNKIFGGEEE